MHILKCISIPIDLKLVLTFSFDFIEMIFTLQLKILKNKYMKNAIKVEEKNLN